MTTSDWYKINCLGLKCPLPVIRLEKAFKKGINKITIRTDDPVSVIDIPLCAVNWGATHSVKNCADGTYEFEIERETP